MACASLTSQNELLQRLALMFYAAFSSSLPIFLQAVVHEQLHPCPLIFLSNVVTGSTVPAS
jgi:hypothetical protein